MNYQGFTFSSPAPTKLDTYVAKFDFNVTQSGTQRIFVRLGLQNDNKALGEWFPGQPAQEVDTNNSKGVLGGYTWIISPTKVNSVHYGFIRQGVGQNGSSTRIRLYACGDWTPRWRALGQPASSCQCITSPTI